MTISTDTRTDIIMLVSLFLALVVDSLAGGQASDTSPAARIMCGTFSE